MQDPHEKSREATRGSTREGTGTSMPREEERASEAIEERAVLTSKAVDMVERTADARVDAAKTTTALTGRTKAEPSWLRGPFLGGDS